MNFLGTAKQGTIACVASPVHLGRSTQVWDATVTHIETGQDARRVSDVTQLILYASA
jgi:acyl-coenzyme A thioesterase PaaI-like protein